jgi:hypothetical protein
MLGKIRATAAVNNAAMPIHSMYIPGTNISTVSRANPAIAHRNAGFMAISRL